MRPRSLVLLCILSALLFSQACHRNPTALDGGTVVGRVVDQTGAIVVGATVTTNPTTSTLSSDAHGTFILDHVPAGTYTVSAVKSSLGSGTVSVRVVEDSVIQCEIVIHDDHPITGNGALKFDGGDGGSGSYVKVAHSTDLNLNGNNYTLEAWFNPGAILPNSPWGQWIMNKGNDNSDNEYLLGIDQHRVMSFWSSYTGTIWSQSSLSPNTWYHVALVVDADHGVATMYINGHADGTVSFNGENARTTTAPLFIGARNYFGQNFGVENWKGAIDEVRIWNSARTAEQIQDNMAVRLTGNESSLNSLWKFDEASGNSLVDATGHSHDGVLVNNVVRIASTAPIH